jgi:exonuclease III
MTITVGAWNVNGITHSPDKKQKVFKTEEAEFMKYIEKHDIIGLIETKVCADDSIPLKGYITYQIGRKVSKNGRFYGGICVAIKEHMKPGISMLKTKDESEYVWVRLHKRFFNMDKDMYICFFYASPEKGDRSFGIEVYDRIVNDIAVYGELGKCVMMGDMNAHTKTEPDYITNDDVDIEMIPLPYSYSTDRVLRRNNCDDSVINEHGKELLDLCIGSGLRIVNGRKFGDIIGKATYYGPMCKQPTTIDY